MDIKIGDGEENILVMFFCFSVRIHPVFFLSIIIFVLQFHFFSKWERFVYYIHSFVGFFTPYLDLDVILLTTPLKSPAPRTTWYFTPGKS